MGNSVPELSEPGADARPFAVGADEEIDERREPSDIGAHVLGQLSLGGRFELDGSIAEPGSVPRALRKCSSAAFQLYS